MRGIITALFVLTGCTVNVSEVTNEGEGKVITEERTEQKNDVSAELTPKLFGLF